MSEVKLPELPTTHFAQQAIPKPNVTMPMAVGVAEPIYTASQLQDYARAAVELDRESRPAGDAVAWRTFDGEGGYELRNYEDNEDYLTDWNRRNPHHIGWVQPLYLAPPTTPTAGEAVANFIGYDHNSTPAVEWLRNDIEPGSKLYAAPPAVSDAGPWHVGKLAYNLYSDDFKHDVALEITGDFADDAEKLAYATGLAAQLNRPAVSEDVRELYEAASKAVHMSETCGPDGRYMFVSKFRTLDDLHAYEDAWRSAMNAARAKFAHVRDNA